MGYLLLCALCGWELGRFVSPRPRPKLPYARVVGQLPTNDPPPYREPPRPRDPHPLSFATDPRPKCPCGCGLPKVIAYGRDSVAMIEWMILHPAVTAAEKRHRLQIIRELTASTKL